METIGLFTIRALAGFGFLAIMIALAFVKWFRADMNKSSSVYPWKNPDSKGWEYKERK